MTFQIGDQVHTKSGKPYVIRGFSRSTKQGEMAYLAPLLPGPRRNHTHALVASLTLIRTAQLALAFRYAGDVDRESAPEFTKTRSRILAAHWLTQAEHRNDDSRAALNLGTGRLLDLEVTAS